MEKFNQYPELLQRVKQQIQLAQGNVVTSANQQLLLSCLDSADWMGQNLYHRVEVCCPVSTVDL